MKWLRHAFATDAPGPATPTPPQADVVDFICREIVRRHLTTPALLFIEMSRPLNYVAAQALHFFHPIVSVLVDPVRYRHFAEFLEHRGSLEHICRRLEHFESLCRDRSPHQSSRCESPPQTAPQADSSGTRDDA